MSFKSLGLSDYLLDTLEGLNYSSPTEIQQISIPIIMDGKDLMAESQTGTGKTASFALPLIYELNKRPTKKSKLKTKILAVTPTRELAVQVAKSLKNILRMLLIN